jgi:hypothetical protein
VSPTGRSSGRGYGIVAAVVVVAGIIAAVVIATQSGGKEHASTIPDAPRETVKVVTPRPATPPDAAVQVVVTPSTPDAAPTVVMTVISNTPDARVDFKPEGDRYHELLAEARRLSRSSCSSAMRLYENAIDVNPRGHEALSGLGTCLLEARDYDRAISNFLGALAISKRYPEALIGAAEAYQHKGNSAAAIANYKLYLEVAPRGDKADLARTNLTKLGNGEGKQSDDDLFGAGGTKPK